MNRIPTGASALRALMAGALMIFCTSQANADLFDKLKKQAKESAEKTKADMKKTVEQEAGVDSSSNPQSLRADLERMWQLCYDQTLTSEQYARCASVCNAASKSIADIPSASKINKKTWEKCKSSYDTALASAPPGKVQTEKEKQLGLPAGAMSSSKTTQSPQPGAAANAPTANNKPATKPAAAKPTAAKPAATPVASTPAALDAAGKAEVNKFAASCPTDNALIATYDCKCLSVEYGNSLMKQRADNLQSWESQYEPYLRTNLENAKKKAVEKGDPKLAEYAQKRYDDGYASAHGIPDRNTVYNGLLGESGTGKRCYSRPAIVKHETQRCLDSPGNTTAMGTPRDADYCGCLANGMADNVLDKGMQFGPARNTANLSCEPSTKNLMKGGKK